MTLPRGVLVLFGVIAAYAAVAAAAWPAVYADMFGYYLQQVKIMPPALLILAPAVALVARRGAPLAYLTEQLRGGIARVAVTVVVFCIGITAFTTYKLAIPDLVPFYADPFFADLDAALHGGNPGEFVHTLLPDFLQYPLGFLYGPVWFLYWFGTITAVAFAGSTKLRLRYFWSMALAIIVLGTLFAIVFSSVGPILYERVYNVDRFPALMAMIKESAIGNYMATASGYLYDTYLSGRIRMGAGISAMPSMHLAIVTLNALMLTRLNRVLGGIAWAYVAAILLGSVFLGWHYAIDGYVSIAVVAIIWVTVGRVIGRAAAPVPAVATPPASAEPSARA